jgi:hypothetical protein
VTETEEGGETASVIERCLNQSQKHLDALRKEFTKAIGDMESKTSLQFNSLTLKIEKSQDNA